MFKVVLCACQLCVKSVALNTLCVHCDLVLHIKFHAVQESQFVDAINIVPSAFLVETISTLTN